MEVEVDPLPDRLPCAFCRQEVAVAAARSCGRCSTPYHPDCWEANDGRCAIYACDPPTPKPPTPNQTVQVPWIPEPLQPRGSRASWGILVAGMLLLSALYRTLTVGVPPPPAPSFWTDDTPSQAPRSQNVHALLKEAARLLASAEPAYARLLEERDPQRRPEERAARLAELRSAKARVQAARAIYLRCEEADPRSDWFAGLSTANRFLEGMARFEEKLSHPPR